MFVTYVLVFIYMVVIFWGQKVKGHKSQQAMTRKHLSHKPIKGI